MTTAIPGQETAFEQDVVAYLDALPSLLGDSEGKYVLVGHGALAEVFENRAAAMSAGYARFGAGGFLVQQVTRHDLDMGTYWHRR
jgi:hypothetical protein